MADRIVVLRDGIVEQEGRPIDLYTRPRNRFVAGFLGAPQMNFLPGIVAPGVGLTVTIDDNRATLGLPARDVGLLPGTAITVGIRPEHLLVSPSGTLAATVLQTEILGAETIIHAELASHAPLIASLRGIVELSPGEIVRFSVDEKSTHTFDEAGLALPPSGTAGQTYLRRVKAE